MPLVEEAILVLTSFFNPSDWSWKSRGVCPSRSSKTKREVALCALLVFLVASTSLAQQVNPTQGIPLYSSQIGGPYDSVNPATSNVLISIPIRAKVGKTPFDFRLVSNSNAYVSQTGTLTNWNVTKGFNLVSSAGDLDAWLTATNNMCCTCNGNADTYYQNFAVVDLTGASHSLPSMTIDTGGCYSLPGPTLTTDGSGYTVVFTGRLSYILYDKLGNKRVFTATGTGYNTTVTDPDQVTLSSAESFGPPIIYTYTDSLGQTVMSQTNNTSNGFPTNTAFTYTDVNGKTQAYTINYSVYTQVTTFGCAQYQVGPVAGVRLASSITTPDGTYGITYETTPNYSNPNFPPPYVTGRIAKLTLPAGGSISYTYSGGINGITCSGIVPTLTRTVDDHNGNVTSWTINNPGANLVSVVDPGSNTTKYAFSGSNVLQKQVYQGSGGTPLVTEITCYNGNFSNCMASLGYGVSVTRKDVFTYIGSSSTATAEETLFDSYGNVFEVKKFDYGAATSQPPVAAPAGTPLSDTFIVYDSPGSCGALAPYVYDRPCSVTKFSSGSKVQQTLYMYNAGGHPTETDRWVSGTANYLKSYATYNTNGTIATSKDVNSATFTINYDGSCNYLFPTGTTYPQVGGASLSTSQVWDCNGGVVTSKTDANGQVRKYDYFNPVSNAADPLWRVKAIVAPYNSTSTTTTGFSYTSTSVESSLVFNSSSADVLSTTDGLGRLISTQNMTAPNSGYDNLVQYGYGWNTTGAVKAQTLPGASSPTTTQLDAAGRAKTVTDGGGGVTSYTYSENDVLIAGPSSSRQVEYDGLGRITSVCELTPNASPANPACNQKTGSGTGYKTTYTYSVPAGGGTQVVVAQGTQTRTYIYDGLGRLTQEQNPESGTTTYTYDSVVGGYCSLPGSSSSPGDLVAKADANGNHVCYYYDVLHRLTDVGNNNQNTANACKRFRYDSPSNGYVTQPAGSKFSNTAGRLIEVETDSGSTLTDEWFSYSPRGELTDVYESTPNSNGYYHTTATYFANGALNTLGGVPQHTSASGIGWTFTVDGEGRPSMVTDNTTPADLVTQTSYNSASQPTNVVLGDASAYGGDSYHYDANTGRMTQYSFNVAAGFTNLLYESQTMDDTSYWVPIGSGVAAPTVARNSVTDPNGGQTADTITYPPVPNPNTEYTLLQQTVTPSAVAGQTFTFSVYLRADTPQSISVGWKTYTASAYAYSIESVTTAWKRFVVTGTVPGTDTSTQITAYLQGDSTTSSQTIYAWGAQLQIGSGTGYQPTGNGADPFSVAGNLTWNSNGTLKQLDIFDPFDTANNQSCKYGYDDLARAASVDCGASTWQQNFTYDPFGNITKIVPTGGTGGSWQPGYNQANNHIALGGTTYDNDGNLTWDTFHQYTWNSYGSVASIDSSACGTNGTCLTYDALGRMVEQNNAGTYQEILYSPIGKLALMTRQIPVNIFLPLPGGEQATYTGSTIRFRHYDWLGTSRFESNTADKEYADLAYAPFGETYSVKSAPTTPYISFTGQQPDTVAGTYDFQYREYNPNQGRWISPDPAGSQAVDFRNPQSFNRYAYATNNPLLFTDPSGLDPNDDNNNSSCDNGSGASDCASGGEPLNPNAETQNGRNFVQFQIIGIGKNDYPFEFAQDDFQRAVDATNATLFWNQANNFPSVRMPSQSSWASTFTKSFFSGFSVFGPPSDSRPSCFGMFLKDSVTQFVGIPGLDTLAGVAGVHYAISSKYFSRAIPNTRVARGGISPKQWLSADEAARVTEAGGVSFGVNADLAMAQALFQTELPAALAGECK